MVPTVPRDGFLNAVLGRDLVARSAGILARAGIEIMPLKGVLLQQLVYADPETRVITDVDLLVRPDRFEEARALLSHAGMRPRGDSPSQIEVQLVDHTGLVLDLHHRLFGYGRYRMATREVFERATQDTERFGRTVRIMSPLDVYAHLVGKLASDHADGRQAQRLADLSLVPGRLGLDAAEVASHLVGCGLRRAARYSLAILVEDADDAFAKRVLTLLPADPLGDLLASGARRMVRALPAYAPIGALPSHLLNQTVPRAAYAMAAAAVNRVRHRWAGA